MSYALFESKVDRYDRTYADVRGKRKPANVTWAESSASILSKTRGFLGGFDYTMQLQVGCPGGCLFCYVSSAPRLAPSDVRERWGFEVRTKRNPIRQLERYLGDGRLAGKTVYWSGVTDPYAAKKSVTREVWSRLNACPVSLRPERLVIQSRFRPDRDADAIAEYGETTTSRDGRPPVLVSYSIGTDRDDMIHAWERATPTFEQRLTAIKKLRAVGVFVVPTLSPFGLWNDLPRTLHRFDSLGVSFITVLFFKARTRTANTPRDFIQHLERDYPRLLDPVWQQAQVEAMRGCFGASRVLVGQEGFAALTKPPAIP